MYRRLLSFARLLLLLELFACLCLVASICRARNFAYSLGKWLDRKMLACLFVTWLLGWIDGWLFACLFVRSFVRLFAVCLLLCIFCFGNLGNVNLSLVSDKFHRRADGVRGAHRTTRICQLGRVSLKTDSSC